MNFLRKLLLITPRTQDEFCGKRIIEQGLLLDRFASIEALIDQELIESQG